MGGDIFYSIQRIVNNNRFKNVHNSYLPHNRSKTPSRAMKKKTKTAVGGCQPDVIHGFHELESNQAHDRCRKLDYQVEKEDCVNGMRDLER